MQTCHLLTNEVPFLDHLGSETMQDDIQGRDETTVEFCLNVSTSQSTLSTDTELDSRSIYHPGRESDPYLTYRSSFESDLHSTSHPDTESNPLMPDLSSPLYAGTPTTLHATVLLILAFPLSHKLTQEALTDLLLLINEIIIKPNCLPLSSYLFYNYLNIKLPSVTRHYYCRSCEQPLDLNLSKTCPNQMCHQVSLDTQFFLEF